MTTITHTHNGSREYFRIKGHAGYNPGNDVVCAGVSTVTYGLINYLEQLQGQREIADLDIKYNDGDIEISFTVIDGNNYYSVKDFVMLSYEMISVNYPDYVLIGGAH